MCQAGRIGAIECRHAVATPSLPDRNPIESWFRIRVPDARRRTATASIRRHVGHRRTRSWRRFLREKCPMVHDDAAAELHTVAVGLRLLVVDNSAALRTRLVNLFGNVPGVEVVGTATDATTTLALIDRERPDVVILDIFMPGNGVTVLAHLHARAA